MNSGCSAVENANCRRKRVRAIDTIDEVTSPIRLLDRPHLKEERGRVLRQAKFRNCVRILDQPRHHLFRRERQYDVALREADRMGLQRNVEPLGHMPKRLKSAISNPNLPPGLSPGLRK